MCTCDHRKGFCKHKWYLKYHCCGSIAKSYLTLCNPTDCSTPGSSVLHCLPEFAEVHVHWVGDAIQPSHPLSAPFVSCSQSFPASGSFPVRQLFTSGGQNTAASGLEGISPSSEYSGLISFRINWFDLLAVQGTLKSLLQHTVQKHQFLDCINVSISNIML